MKTYFSIKTSFRLAMIACLWLVAVIALVAATILPVEQTVQEVPEKCYFCLYNGTPQNKCAIASGSGWKKCARGYRYCGYGGGTCSTEP